MAAEDEMPVTSTEKSQESKAPETSKNGGSNETEKSDTKSQPAVADTVEGADEDDYERYDKRNESDDHKDGRGSRRGGKDDRSKPRGTRGSGGRGDRNKGKGRFEDRNNRGKSNGNGRGNFQNRGKNVKTRYDRQAESSDADEIRRQVEFYFSDSNLPIDRFLLEHVGGTENKPVPLKIIHDFKRMRHFQPFTAVVEAVKQSDILEVNDQDEVYRKTPLAEQFTMSTEENGKILTTVSMKRSVYVKGFGEEGEKTAFEIEEFFQPYGIKGVRLRRDDRKNFKGSVFVEFETEEAAHDFLELDPKPKFNGQELLIKSKKAYVDEKNEAIKDGTVRPRSPTRSYHDRSKPSRPPKRQRKDDDDDDDEDWRTRRDRFQGKQHQDKRRKDNDGEPQVTDAAAKESNGSGEDKNTAEGEDKDGAKEEPKADTKPTEPEKTSTG